MTVTVMSKVNEGVNGSKGVKQAVTLTLTKKSEYLQEYPAVQHRLSPNGAGLSEVHHAWISLS
jgi:hypothetical protein